MEVGARSRPRARLPIIAITAGLLALLGSGVPSDALARPLVARSLNYCAPGGVPLLMDTYAPASGGLHPAVLRVHGGGWVSGTRAYGVYPEAVTALLVSRGVLVASIDYRLAPEYTWPAQRDDVDCALAFLRDHALELGIDPTRIGAIGESAGGQLVSLVGLAGTSDHRPRPSLRAVVDLWGPTDLSSGRWDPYMLEAGRKTFGTELGSGSPILDDASPVHAAHPGAPPFLIIQGADDQVVPAAQSAELAGRLGGLGDRVRLTVVEHAGHGLVPVNGLPSLSVDEVAGEAADFLLTNLSAG